MYGDQIATSMQKEEQEQILCLPPLILQLSMGRVRSSIALVNPGNQDELPEHHKSC